jgi:hypothetical protein
MKIIVMSQVLAEIQKREKVPNTNSLDFNAGVVMHYIWEMKRRVLVMVCLKFLTNRDMRPQNSDPISLKSMLILSQT